METDHQYFMRRAIQAARQTPERPFGTVIADPATASVVCEGWNRSASNPTWHGEIDAINRLCRLARTDTALPDYRSLVLYTTAEPCVMCQGAILWTGIGAVVFGTSAATLAELGFRQFRQTASEIVDGSFFPECEVIGGVLQEECDRLFVDVGRQPAVD